MDHGYSENWKCDNGKIMNIIDCERKNDQVIQFNGVIKRIGKTFRDRRYNGYSLGPGSSIRINDATRWITFRNFPNDCSYYHMSEIEGQLVNVCVSEHGNQNIYLSKQINESTDNLQLLKIKWPLTFEADTLDLTISAENSNNHPVEFYIFENIDHSSLYQICVGEGVELGPGNNPRLLPDKDRRVDYIEAYSIKDWYDKYNKNKEDQGLWHLYKIAKAHELPYKENSLDFIFGGHLFEHLINPIGHLERWAKLLKNGGYVAQIIPNMRGCFEYRSWPTPNSEWIEDYHDGVFEPSLKHYEVFCGYHGGEPVLYYQEGRNVHFSFFEKNNLSWLLSYACKYLGFTNYTIQWSPNHFDISFILKK